MVQIVEWNPQKGYEFGAGQAIVTAIASIVGLQTFRILVGHVQLLSLFLIFLCLRL